MLGGEWTVSLVMIEEVVEEKEVGDGWIVSFLCAPVWVFCWQSWTLLDFVNKRKRILCGEFYQCVCFKRL